MIYEACLAARDTADLNEKMKEVGAWAKQLGAETARDPEAWVQVVGLDKLFGRGPLPSPLPSFFSLSMYRFTAP